MILAATGGGRAEAATRPHASGPQDEQLLAIEGSGKEDKGRENMAPTSSPTLPPQLPSDVATNSSMDSEVRVWTSRG